jgi:outer membrane protein TolC
VDQGQGYYEPPPADLSELVATAYNLRPEMGIAQANIDQAQQNLALARATDKLSVVLQGQYTRDLQASALSTPQSWQVMLGLNQPLLTGGEARGRVRQAEAGVRAAELSLQSQRQAVALEVTQEYLSLRQAGEQLRVAEQGVIEAEERLRISQVRYEAGVALAAEVLDAQTALAAAEAALVDALYDQYQAIFRLYYAIGEPLKEVSA